MQKGLGSRSLSFTLGRRNPWNMTRRSLKGTYVEFQVFFGGGQLPKALGHTLVWAIGNAQYKGLGSRGRSKQ